MEKDELLNMLDLGGKTQPGSKEEPVTSLSLPGSLPPTQGQTQPVKDSALEVDEWDLERGIKLCSDHGNQLGHVEALAWSDLHASVFRTEPKLVENCRDKRRHEFMKTLMETPEYESLRKSTVLNELASEMASVQFAREYSKLLEKDQQRKQAKKPKRGQPQQDQEVQAELDLLGAVTAAVTQASEEVEEMEEMCKGLGMGDGSDGTLNSKQVASIFRRVRNSPTLRRICELAGRYRRAAQSKQRQKTTHGYDEVIGVHQDGEVARLLPVELGSLADEELELNTMRRLVERQTMCREYRGSEHQAKGPIVVCVDESGSMRGEPVAQAKAFALAMCWVARQQNRWCALVGYAGGHTGTRVALPPGKWKEEELLRWLEHFYGGGTTMDVPLQELPTTYWQELNCPKGKTDVIIITDGIVHVPEMMEKQFNEWKHREKVRCISLILAPRAGDLERVSDECHLIPNIDVTQEAIGRCLGI